MTTPNQSYLPFLVAAQKTAVDLSLDPWLTPPDAYQQIYDAYQYLGVTTKRNGYTWFDSVPHAINANSNPYQNVEDFTSIAGVNTVTTVDAHGLSTGDIIRLTNVVTASGIFTGGNAPLNGTRWTITVTGADTFTLDGAGTFTGTYMSGTGTVSTFPGDPITAIATWIDPNNNQILMVLDSKRASIFDASGTNQCLVPIGNTDQFSALTPFLFWWENYFGYIFFTNNSDTMFVWNTDPTDSPDTNLASGLEIFTPQYDTDSSHIVNTCLMIKSFGNRLLLFNTVEDDVRNPTRIRWCAPLTDPTAGSLPNAVPVWYTTPGATSTGYGGYQDISDSTYLITLAQIQTNLLISSQISGQNAQFAKWYEVRQVNDPSQPFVFVSITNSRNVNSTFGTIVLDRQVTSLGNTGLIIVDGNTSYRNDQKIPQFAIDTIDQALFQSCFGIRYDLKWQTWLLYPDSASGQNNILVFNYEDRSWSIFRPSYESGVNLTCFGLYLYPFPDPEWQSYNGVTLPLYTWNDFSDETWQSLPQGQSPMLLSGDAQGNVWWMDQGGGDAADNVVFGGTANSGLPITMDLVSRQWFPFAKEGLAAQLGYIDFLINGDPETLVQISFNIDNYASDYLTSFFACVPYEDIQFSTITNVTRDNPAVVTSEDHGLVSGQSIYIFAVEGMTELNGSVFTVTVINPNVFSLDGVDSSAFFSYTGGGVVASGPLLSSTFWTRVNCGQTGVFHQFELTTTGVDQSFDLHAIIFWMKATGRIYK